jgi:hypothetical protein
MRGLGSRGRLVELGGGEWGLMAQWWSMASPRSLIAMGGRSGHASEGEREQGEVGVVFPYRVGSRWYWSGGASRWLGVRGGGGRKEERERIYPRSPRVSLLLCVQVLGDKY